MNASTKSNTISTRGWLVVVWVLVALFATRAMLFFPGPPQLDWQRLLIRIFTDWVVWLAFAPAIVWLARRFPFEAHHWPRALVIHFAAALAALVVHALIRVRLGAVIVWMPRDPLSVLMYAQAHLNFLTYWAIVGATHIADYYHRFRDRERRALELEAELTRAQLDALTVQLHPHFLFNTMNAISAFMHEDVQRADRMLGRLGDLLRTTLQQSGAQETRLSEEIAFIERYLQIQQERFGDRLRVIWKVDPALENALVPPLLLQPIVENSVQHGISDRLEGGTITIAVRRDHDRLELSIADDGNGLSAKSTESTGIGLSNTRRRLQQIYGADHLLELRAGRESGAEVIVNIPYRI